jgi:hypothetical protein
MFKVERKNVHDEEQSDQSSIVNDDLVQIVGQQNCERRRFTISELSCEFPHVLHTVLYEIIAVSLCFHKFCTKWVPKMLTGVHKTQRVASALTFLERYHRDSDEFLSHLVTGDKTRVSFVCQNQTVVKAVDANTFTKQTEKCKQASARKLMATVFWDRKGVLILEIIQQGNTITL